MTDTSLAEAEATLQRLGEHRRELRERQAALQRQIEGFARVDQADVDERIREIRAGNFGAAQRRSLDQLFDEARQLASELELVGRALETQKDELSAARRRHAREVAAELAPEYDAVVSRIAAALEDLLEAQTAERALHVRVRQESGVEGVLPELGRALPGVDMLLARAREHFAARRTAA
jgi:chromosome segregation ATPase